MIDKPWTTGSSPIRLMWFDARKRVRQKLKANAKREDLVSWLNNDEKQKQLKNRDWSSSRASQIENRPGHAYGSREIHERTDGRYVVEKDMFGNVVSVKKK